MALQDMRLGFVGCGNMGQALLQGWLRAGLVEAASVTVATASTGPVLSRKYGVKCGSVESVIGSCDWIVLAVKPQKFVEVLGDLRFRDDQVVLSVMAGVGISHLRGYQPGGAVVRVMPNLASRIGHGATVGYAGPNAGVDVKRTVHSLFSAVGAFVWLPQEEHMHVGTALVGSGPAFIFKVIKALVDSATALGLDAEASRSLAFTMVTGSSELARGTNQSLDELCDSVASPGGTTRAGLSVLDERNLETHIGDAVKAATHRSYELAQEGETK